MKVLKSRNGLGHKMVTEFVNDNNIAKEDIFSIVSNGAESFESFTIFYYEEPKPDEKKKGFWG
ncbi:MAG TPA: hypothetical protein VNY73_06145 [Bacteroidia bacterium]|jgi:hypothetical protein|nr:hypothetical protein [Bacteroidia bacterium]